jgi:molecular chaperone IbpA
MVFTFPQLDQRLLLNTTIGFDRLFSILEHSAASKPPSYPPYNIVKGETENSYKIELAVAGFNRDELDIFKEESDLVVSGKKDSSPSGEFVYRGIAARDFKSKFTLADYVEVVDARLDSGILTVMLELRVPEEKKPKKINISTGSGENKPSSKKEFLSE